MAKVWWNCEFDGLVTACLSVCKICDAMRRSLSAVGGEGDAELAADFVENGESVEGIAVAVDGGFCLAAEDYVDEFFHDVIVIAFGICYSPVFRFAFLPYASVFIAGMRVEDEFALGAY